MTANGEHVDPAHSGKCRGKLEELVATSKGRTAEMPKIQEWIEWALYEAFKLGGDAVRGGE